LKARIRPATVCLVLGLLTAGILFVSVSQLQAQSFAPMLKASEPRRDDKAGHPEDSGSATLPEQGTAIRHPGAEEGEWGGQRGLHAGAAEFAGRMEAGPDDPRPADRPEAGGTPEGAWIVVGEPAGESWSPDEAGMPEEWADEEQGREEGDTEEVAPAGAGFPGEPAADGPGAAATTESNPLRSEVSGGGFPFVQRASEENVPLGLIGSPYRYPEGFLQPLWNECLTAIENRSLSSLRPALNRLYEAKLDTGFRNMPDHATLLIRRAYRLLDEKDFTTARLVGDTAYNLAPEYYPVSLALSNLALKDPQRGLGKYLYWRWVSLKQQLRDFTWQFTTAGKVFGLLLMTLYLSFLLLGVYLLARYAGVILHFVHDRVPAGSLGMAALGSFLGGVLLLLLFLPGPFWVTVFLGFLAGRFARRWEKGCFVLFLLLWALSPWVFKQTVCFFSPLSDATYAMQRCLRGDWDATGEEALSAASETNPKSLSLRLTRALVAKRRGDYEEAVHILQKALQEHPQAASLWNNLGNLHAIQGNLQEAKGAYGKALLYGNGSAAPHYNLSQLLRREFAFLRGAQEFQTARKIDAERVDYFTYIHSPNPNRFFMDEEPAMYALWSYASHSDPETERAADDLWRSTAAGVPLRQTPWVFLVLAGVYTVFVGRRRRGQEPFACSGCGQVVCGKCDAGAEVGGLCSPCYQALYQRENIPRERRHEQIRKMARYQSRRSRRLLLANLVTPGIGFSLLEEKARGALILFGLLFVLLVAMFWSAMLPVPMTVWETGGSHVGILSILLLILLYGVVQQRFLAKIRARR
jgi:tetratricopeptide (TPR) repeat protein